MSEPEFDLIVGDLPDLTGFDITLIGEGDDTVLAHALRRIVEELANPTEAVAGWNAAIG